jgi:hypothetical protein
MIGYVPEPNYVGQAPLVENYDPSFGFMLKQGAKKMFSDMSILLPASMADVAISEMRGGKITEEEYKESEFFDPQIKWDDSFTEAKARLLKDRMDAEREYAYYLEQAQDFTDYIAFYGGVIAGAVPDPLNYIPLLGQFDKPRRALQYAGIGARSSRALLGAADAALLTTLASPLLMSERASYQQKYDAQDVLFDIGIATGLGGGLGALFGRVKPEDSYPGRIPTLEEARAYDPDVPSTITDPPGQLQQFIERVPPENRANAVRKGLLQQRTGRPIDVSAEMQPVLKYPEEWMTPEATSIRGRLQELNKKDKLTPDEVTEIEYETARLKQLEERFRQEDDFVPDYTVAKLEEPEPLVDEVIAAIEKQSDEELDAGIRELDAQRLLKEEDAKALARDEDLTTEQSNREIEQYNGDLIFCLMRNG